MDVINGKFDHQCRLNLTSHVVSWNHSSNVNFYWFRTPSRLDIVQIIPVDLNKEYDCSSKVVLSTITQEFTQNTVIVLLEEVFTKEVLRCDVIVDVINSLSIVTKTRRLFVEESPEIFEVRAYDREGFVSSTLIATPTNPTWIIISWNLSQAMNSQP